MCIIVGYKNTYICVFLLIPFVHLPIYTDITKG